MKKVIFLVNDGMAMPFISSIFEDMNMSTMKCPNDCVSMWNISRSLIWWANERKKTSAKIFSEPIKYKLSPLSECDVSLLVEVDRLVRCMEEHGLKDRIHKVQILRWEGTGGMRWGQDEYVIT